LRAIVSGRDDHGDVAKPTTAQPVAVHRQSTAFPIGQADPATDVRAEDPVLFDQVGHRLLLALVEPAEQPGQKQA
jgi:hypothetical protein